MYCSFTIYIVIYIYSLNTMYMYYVYILCHICTYLILAVCSPLSTEYRALLGSGNIICLHIFWFGTAFTSVGRIWGSFDRA